jgi:type I restriction enzyme M protein
MTEEYKAKREKLRELSKIAKIRMANLVVNSTEWGKNVNEPACGSGRLVLAANQVAKGNYYICQDLDPICCKMTAINLCFHEIRAEIHCMDSLRMTDRRFTLVTNYEYWKNETNSIFLYNNS